MKFKGYNFCTINQMIINTISCRCNKTYQNYEYCSNIPIETKINIIIAKNPQILENAKDILIRKKSLI